MTFRIGHMGDIPLASSKDARRADGGRSGLMSGASVLVTTTLAIRASEILRARRTSISNYRPGLKGEQLLKAVAGIRTRSSRASGTAVTRALGATRRRRRYPAHSARRRCGAAVPAFTSSRVTAVPLRVMSASDSATAFSNARLESRPVVEIDVRRGAQISRPESARVSVTRTDARS